MLAGCTFGRSSTVEHYQAEGVTLVLAVQSSEASGIIAGELLTVEPDAYLLDAVNQIGDPVRVVRVPMRDITRGAAYSGRSPRGEVRSVVDTPPGMRRVARLGEAGRARGMDLQRLSRFPFGIPDAALSRLLDARVQTEVAGLGFAPIRSTY
ncbi:hypothetical protein BSZ37_15205 [Rubrivirga marina]|uniref:Uncharacterized protein n=1 Tax=Rubrivirga marina TaxID=1196024 RepID=A0A271J2M7_9BACT|nr:hypothetical protein BSZ37_15205 [Rubrivirga marina]